MAKGIFRGSDGVDAVGIREEGLMHDLVDEVPDGTVEEECGLKASGRRKQRR